MAIQRNNVADGAKFTVGLNITLNGSKRMNGAQQEDGILVAAGKDGTIKVRIESSEGVLVDEVLLPKQFSTGSVGWGLQARGIPFE